ncbi:mechanosensitive ion channel family protein [Simiduia sp. 21SJ11W-1]|uniref:mechanosensitive ion channel family protein n=1 Tax=Simiduia sp. 21SJ11W-1 TaxID=2909669 RepID=UPI00209DCFCA|nr:mechanosensitive ion channel domain-containing protein [Simiduia sp. 21SJ11W-1]UTA47857.1 mechanosensitive ion channel family protein [Simiduia sp. 21SJ11W-1]
MKESTEAPDNAATKLMETPTEAFESVLTLFSPGKLLAIAMLAGMAWLLLTVMLHLLQRLALQFPRHRLLINRIYPLTRVVVWSAVVLYSVVGIIQPHPSVLFAMLGSAGLALGLATQEPIKNMVSGLIIMINPPYRVGDMVNLAGHYGEVIKLEWSVTWLRTFDDNTVMVPNAEALKTAVSNANSGALDELVAITVHLPAHADHQRAMQLAREATLCSPYCYLKKPVTVLLGTECPMGEVLLTVTVKAYVLDVRLERRFASDIHVRVIDAYKTAGLWPLPFERVTTETTPQPGARLG